MNACARRSRRRIWPRATPWGAVFPLLAIVGLVAIWWYQRQRRDGRSLVSSGLYLAGMLTSAAFTLYPAVLPAVDPSHTLTVANASAPTYGLVVGLIWWIIGMLLAALYVVLIYRLFRGKVRLTEGDSGY
jgi:cytochrome bd ubiquinol oxidase subunit II